MTLARRRLQSPLGPLQAEVQAGALRRLVFSEDAVDTAAEAGDAAVLDAVARQLTDYFAGTRRAFELPLAPEGTAFERRVWAALLTLPHGQTRSYGEIARSLGQPSAARAVGTANARNPIAILIPCHRIIGSDGRLTGYAGGLARKEALLRLEGALPAPLL